MYLDLCVFSLLSVALPFCSMLTECVCTAPPPTTRHRNRNVACANGEVAPFMGHNAFLRWRAIQDAAFVDPADGKEKIWSESNVSEDFDMALRLMLRGYLIRCVRLFFLVEWGDMEVQNSEIERLIATYRWATYSEGGFKEGVSLSADDELNRWQKYAYGCNECVSMTFLAEDSVH